MRNRMVKGMSIAEMAIVVFVIAVISGIVAKGVSVVRLSEMRRFIMDVQEFQTAIESFNSKYEALPGDMDDSCVRWQSLLPNCGYNIFYGRLYSGDGDDRIELHVSGNVATQWGSFPKSVYESYRAWELLAALEYISGSYTGIGTGTSKEQADVSINVPESKRDKVGYFLVYDDTRARNEIQIGGFAEDRPLTGPALTPQEAAQIDEKMDDGRPDRGNIIAVDAELINIDGFERDEDETCLDVSDPSTPAYNFSNTTLTCRLTFSLMP